MTQGHKGSIVPHKGGVAPMDSNTVFYAQFNSDTRDIVKGLKQIGYEKCFQFNTIGGKEYIETPLTLPENGTLELWYYPSSFYDYNSVWENSINADNWECWIYASGILSARAGGGSQVSYTLPSPNKWYHIAFTWEKTGNISLIVDGILRDTQAIAWINPKDLILGGKQNIKTQGKMSDIRVWNYAKSDAQIVKTMNMYYPEDRTKLLAHWSLNENSGNIAYDYSGNGNDGVVFGGSWVEGKSIYSLTKNGIAIEEGTTNYFPYPMTQQYSGGVLSNKNSYYVVEGYRVTAVEQPTNAPLPGCRVVISSTQSFTVSGYSNLPNVKIYHRGWDSSNVQVYAQTNTSVNTDNYGFFTKTINVGTQVGLNYVAVGIGEPTLTNYWIEKVQVEKKEFATSFVDGTRSNGVIEYPSLVFPEKDFTVSMWVSHTGDLRAASHNYKLFALGDNYLTNRLTLWNYYPIGTDTRKLILDSGSSTGTRQYTDLISPNPFQVGKWEMLTISFHYETKTFKLYRNNILWSRLTITSLSGIDKVIMSNSGWVVDELRIDKVVRTLEEIQAWYYQGRSGG